MKKALIGLSVMLLLFGTVSVAGASPITFTDITTFTEMGTDLTEDFDGYYGWGYVNKLEGIGNWDKGIGPLGSDFVTWTHNFDFIPAVQTVLSGNLSLHLRDDGGLWDSYELAFGKAEDGTWGFGEVDTGMYSYDVSASFLADGKFTITLMSVWGDFYIDKSELEITYEPVPEPATMLLFGAGLVGLAGIHRKKRA